MKLPVNTFKSALASRQAQIGLWVGLADPYAAEMLATTGFDWLLVDGEHAPNARQGIEYLRPLVQLKLAEHAARNKNS